MKWNQLHCIQLQRLLGVRCGSVFNVVWNQERKKAGFVEEDCLNTEKAIKVAVDAIKILIDEDRNVR